MRKTVLLCASLVYLASLVAWSDTATLQPAADTTLFENVPNNNLGGADLASGTIRLGTKTRALVRFNLSGKVPANATVTSAEFRLRVSRVPLSPVPSTFGLHRVLQAWGEGSQGGAVGSQAANGDATWNARLAPATPWNAPGAAASSDYVTKASATRQVVGLGSYTFASTADLVADVQAWLANPATNFGWILISQSENTPSTARRFASREDPNNAPTLVINFTAPAAATPPTITAQPQNQTVAAGASATFTVAATGTEPLSYQWKFNGTDVAGATSPTLTLANVQSTNAGKYTVAVSNAGGTITSTAATLTVLNAPTITQQPQSQSVNAGAAVTFSVTASGSEPLSYQWKFNGSDIAGATGPTLSLPNAQLANAGNYTVSVGNSAGSVSSATATLIVMSAPTITQQPQSQSVNAGASVTFSVSASGSEPLRYQWKFNGTDIAGATGPTLSLPTAQPANAGNYSVSVSNSAGSVSSASATLTVTSAPAITQQPQSQSVNAGANVTFGVTANSSEPLSYQWKFNGTDIAGATGPTLSLPNVQTANAGNYSVTVSNSVGAVSSASATLIVLSAPTITNQPQSRSVNAGANVTFSVTANGSEPLSYQWRFNGSDIAGATGTSLNLSNVQPANAGAYTVSVDNSAGSVTSASGTLTVVSAPAITQQPQSQSVSAGANATFSVTANGSEPLSYQWKFSGSAIAGATGPTFSLPNAQPANAGSYTVTVSNSAGAVSSASATLIVLSAPTIVQQPQSQTVNAGASITFSVTASGSEPLSYQWKFNGGNIAGATGPTLDLPSIQLADAGNYTVIVGNSIGTATSAGATLTVVSAPVITQQPQSQTVNAGASVTFRVAANGSEPLSYQWKFNGADIAAATGPTLSLPNVQSDNAGNYSVTVSNFAGSVTSSVTQLTVNPPDPSLSVTDVAITENNSGIANADFSITLSAASDQPVTVHFATSNGTATAGSDYTPNSGTLTFTPGETNRPVTVQIVGDALNEADETFFVALSNPVNATIAKSRGQGTIIDDDPPPSISINDVSVSEGNSGTTNAVFTVSLSTTSGKAVSMDFTTSSGTATLGNDFTSVSGTLTFSPGETSKTIAVPIVGDIAVESDESFFMNLTNPANATIARGQASGTILTDDFPISITTQPLSQTVSFAGTATFTVSAVGTGTLIYQWKFNGNDVSNATNSTLTLPNVQPANAGSYTVVVSDAAGSLTGATATLTVLSAPTITQQPQSQSVNAGANVTFSVTASGSEPLSYQWKFNAGDVLGATNASLTLLNVQAAQAGRYSVAVSNPAGAAISSDAVLTVNAAADVPPAFDRIELEGRTINIQFTVQPTYQLALEFTESLALPNWTALTNVSAKLAPLKIVVPDSTAPGPQRFYRLKVTGRVR